MAPKLRVLVSTPDSPGYPPTTPIPVNSPSPSPLSTPGFEGHIWVFVKDYSGAHLAGDGAEYFAEEGREGMTYGIVVKGRFREEVGGDEVVFGNVFEKPIRDSLPWGTSVATKFMYFIDPTLELDIYADKPWALSPALATMNYLSLQESSDIPKDLRIKEDAPEYLKAKTGGPSAEGSEKAKITARRKWLGSKANREKVKLNKDVVVGMEFANGLLGQDFNTLSATLPPPFKASFPLLKYWDGQPVTYACQRRAKDGESPVGQEVFWSVAFEIVDEDAKRELEKKHGGKGGEKGKKGEKESVDESAGDSQADDVD
ncbi:hypothetical protein I350_07583 [Cryptococcus amylolentus CBS 6273]|uniref:Domain of unknown function at the cortex 1 domain-containing protein n=1 Tax=Cryptococcus amylolentus CBS 6273 TaxID=1296118 RepID=A0A1E3JCW2_9TREE|nr:hypothetical protein I350_07583 [Cryptococcus amylolentus CBS 6273]